MTETELLLHEVRTAREMPSPETARLIRQAAKVSQSRMAAALGINRATLSRWETGTMRPRPAQRARWHQLLTALQHEVAA